MDAILLGCLFGLVTVCIIQNIAILSKINFLDRRVDSMESKQRLDADTIRTFFMHIRERLGILTEPIEVQVTNSIKAMYNNLIKKEN